MKRLFLGIFLLLLFPTTVLALSPPTQQDPQDQAAVTSSKLTWSAPSYTLYSTTPYNIQVNSDPNFPNPSTSPNRDYKTSNIYYTPQIAEGGWYWRIRAKDSGGTWSDWSNSWSFTLSASTPAPNPSSTPTPSPTPTQSSSTTSSKSTTSTKSSTSSTSKPSSTPNPTQAALADITTSAVSNIPVKHPLPDLKVAGEATQSSSTPTPVMVASAEFPKLPLILGILLLLGGGSLLRKLRYI